jgi:UTP--glucose-1-phosphate uridylyltransferase
MSMKHQTVKKAIIPVAGFGTRFLPATKNQPKELLPIVDKPTIHYIVDAAVKSGITDIIIVTSYNKRPVEDYFDHAYELEDWLKKNHKNTQLEIVQKIPKMANFIYIRQKGPMGNGTPVLNAKNIIGDEPFAVFFGDEFYNCPNSQPWIKQLISTYEKYQNPVVAVMNTNEEGTKRYGIIDGIKIEDNVYQINKILEKPGPKKAPTKIAIAGGYILTPDIFPLLEKTKPGHGGEVWLADAMAELNKKRPFYASMIKGEYFDGGSVLGWLKANTVMALSHPDIKDDYLAYLKQVLNKHK